jgi:hypothetical protein
MNLAPFVPDSPLAEETREKRVTSYVLTTTSQSRFAAHEKDTGGRPRKRG